jgi:uncharacterized membrane protein SpoIIM required for sporulation
MHVQRWIARREPDWQTLEGLLQRVEAKGLKALQPHEVQALASLYRSVSADLARASTYQVGESLIYRLQSLTSRSYSQIYQGSRRQEWGALVGFYRWGFPAIVRQTLGYTLLATAIFGISALIAWWLAWQDPAFMQLVVPESLIEKVRDRGELWMGSIVGNAPIESSGIMTNNISVCFKAIAGGMVAGLGTVAILVLNGFLIGGVGALVGQNHLAYPFWAFVFPHGALELPAIFLSGGAGLLLARALVMPGPYRRIDALKVYGPQAAQLVYGIVPLLVIAGVVEGFFSPHPWIPALLKYLVGVLLFCGLVQYCRTRRGA